MRKAERERLRWSIGCWIGNRGGEGGLRGARGLNACHLGSRATGPTRPASRHEFVECFRREIEAAFPSNCGPAVQVKLAEVFLIADLRSRRKLENRVSEIDLAAFSRCELHKDFVVFQISGRFDDVHTDQTKGSTL